MESAGGGQAAGLVFKDSNQVKQELGITAPEAVSTAPGQDPALDKKADDVVGALLSFKMDDAAAQTKSKASVEAIGMELQKAASQQSEILKEPIKKMAYRSEEGGEVGNALVDLRVQVEALDPTRFDFEPGWATRMVGYLPGVGSPLKRYFSKYESSQTIINAIVKSLETGREQLSRDNITLIEDQKRMREVSIKLEKAIKLAQLIDQKLQYKLERDLVSQPEMAKFVGEELVFPLRQRIIDLQQQLAVSQQGVLATEIVIRNNKELIRGVNRALNVTISALQVAVTVALALANQRIVLDKVTGLNETTSDIIRANAAMLKKQGAEIHKQASTSQLSIESLKQAFADIHAAMEDIAQFRMKALPEMATSITELDQLTRQAGTKIQEKERGNRSEPIIPIEID